MARILVVDDEEAICQLLQRVLQAEGHTVQIAASVNEAWEIIEDGDRPDAIFADINMPEETGVELVFRMRERADLEKIPVIFVTAYRSRSTAIRTADEAVIGVLDKPFEPADVVAMLDKALAWKDE